jgi:hypothetical protein
MNYIDKIREATNKYYQPDNEIIDSRESFFSPNGKYKIETKVFKPINLSSRNITKVEIFNDAKSDLIFSFFVNEETFFHSWVTKQGIEYLLCAEDLCGGQTIIDLTNKKMSSYTTETDDGLIWIKHLLSPNENLLAVFGCGWGSPFFVTVYHFDKPMDLPLEIAYEPSCWTGYDIIEWVNNNNLNVKNSADSKITILQL